MNITQKKGVRKIQCHRSDIRCLQEAKYLLTAIADNMPTDGDPELSAKRLKACQDVADAVNTMQRVCEWFGSKYLDDDGNLKETAREAAVTSSVPA